MRAHLSRVVPGAVPAPVPVPSHTCRTPIPADALSASSTRLKLFEQLDQASSLGRWAQGRLHVRPTIKPQVRTGLKLRVNKHDPCPAHAACAPKACHALIVQATTMLLRGDLFLRSRDSIGSGRIGSDSIESGRIGSDSIGSGRMARIGSGRMGSDSIGPGRIGSDSIGSDSIGSGRIGSDSIGSGRIGSDSI